MKEHVLARRTNRREMLKLSGLGVMGGAAVQALSPGKTRADEPGVGTAYASWISGHGMQIEYPDRLVHLERDAWGTLVEGKPGTTNWFHFAIPTPVIVNDVRLRAHSVLISFSAGSVDAFVRDVHVWDGSHRLGVFDNRYLPPGEPAERLILPPDNPKMGFGLGISIGVGFGVEPMRHDMTFYAAGCDFVV